MTKYDDGFVTVREIDWIAMASFAFVFGVAVLIALILVFGEGLLMLGGLLALVLLFAYALLKEAFVTKHIPVEYPKKEKK